MRLKNNPLKTGGILNVDRIIAKQRRLEDQFNDRVSSLAHEMGLEDLLQIPAIKQAIARELEGHIKRELF